MARRTQGCCFAWILRILHLDLTSLCYTETNMQEGINMDFKKAGITGLVLIALAFLVLLYTVVREDWVPWRMPWTIWGFIVLACAGLAVLLVWHRCPYCGKGLKFGAKHCTHCGSSLLDCGHIQQNREMPASAKLPRSHIRAERVRWVLYVPVLIGLVFSPFVEWWSYPMTIVMLGVYLLSAVAIARVWMRCPHCGKTLDGGEAYCPRCGGRLER